MTKFCNVHHSRGAGLYVGLPYFEKRKSGQWMATFDETKFMGHSNSPVRKAGRWIPVVD